MGEVILGSGNNLSKNGIYCLSKTDWILIQGFNIFPGPGINNLPILVLLSYFLKSALLSTKPYKVKHLQNIVQ